MASQEKVDEEIAKDWSYLVDEEPLPSTAQHLELLRLKLGAEAVDNATPLQLMEWYRKKYQAIAGICNKYEVAYELHPK